MIIKTYYLIIIDITKIIDDTINANMFFLIFNRLKWEFELWTVMDQSGPNYIEVD